MLTGSQIRRKFLDYFIQNRHKEVHSSSLVPANDPTLLFTNAGMNQFKDVFLGLEKRDYNRATTSQKCVRAGGKHNDLENVGFTNRHHTFFEMLGNFSFGDYFKRDAVKFAWELCTSPQWFGLPKDKLFATIFKGEGSVPRDAEAHGYWLEQGVPKERIYEFGLKDNFWQMGDTGPCGPCSELHYDMGPAASSEGHTNCEFGCECGRYVEIWNLVFMQFDRDAAGVLNPLPKPSIDTGMGLERMAAVAQGKLSNYDTDLFTPLIKRAAELLGIASDPSFKFEIHRAGAAPLRVIADHARATTFLISDGVLPANEGRGYVLRKIMRRAIRHGRLLGQTKPFLHQMVYAVRDLMQDAYPELVETADRVAKVVEGEETRFAHVMDIGLRKLEADLEPLVNAKRAWERYIHVDNELARLHDRDVDAEDAEYRKVLSEWNALRDRLDIDEPQQGLDDIHALAAFTKPVYEGEKAFKLYDTFGLPLDFIVDACRDVGVSFDQDGFDRAMSEQRVRAQRSWKATGKQSASPALIDLLEGKNPYADSPGVVEAAKLPISLRFVGYRQLRTITRVVAVLWPDPQTGVDHTRVMTMPNQPFHVVLEETPFYAESGGQVGDHGWLYSEGGNELLAEVTGCHAPVKGVNLLTVLTKTQRGIQIGDVVTAVVDSERRADTMRNHTATHLLHAALREVLGKHVKQAGSLVSPGRLRFDFSHFTAIADEEMQDIEDIVNKEVLKNDRVQVIEDVPIDVAVNEYKAMALFGEKYGDKVRVIKIGDFSTELCGGTHTAATGEIGLVKVLDEGSVSSGVRRVEAVTGEGSLKHFRADHQLEHVARAVVRTAEEPEGSLATALRHEIESRDEEIRKLRKELEQSRMKSASAAASSIEDKIKIVSGVKVLAHRADNLERPQLRTLVDNLRQKIGSGVVVVGSVSDGNVALIAGVTKDLTSRLQAGKVIGPVAEKVGGKGGGRPDMAEAGGKNPEGLDDALAAVVPTVESLLK